MSQFVILTAHGYDPHQEALSTLRTRRATVRTVDIFAVPLPSDDGQPPAMHGSEFDTSLLLYVDARLVELERARDFPAPLAARLRSGATIPDDSPGSLGRPTLASAEKGQRLYQVIYERIATRVFGRA